VKKLVLITDKILENDLENVVSFKHEISGSFDNFSYLAKFGTFSISVARRLLLEVGRVQMYWQGGIFRERDVQNQSGGKI
jgi:hypothetical protein